MRLDARAFGLAAGAVAGVLFIICAAAVAIAPEATTAIAGEMIHADLSGITRTLTFGNFIGGLICWSVGTALTFWLVAAIYNRLAGEKARVRLAEPQVAAR